MHHWVLLGALVALAAPSNMTAQEVGANRAPDSRGVQVEGWKGRLDLKAEKQGRKISDAKFWSTDDGWHVAAGPPAIFWSPAEVAAGEFTVSATFSADGDAPHRETYGLFMGGSDLDGRVPNYLYCTLYGVGMFSVKHRFGEELHSLVERRASPAINRRDAKGHTTNTMAWRVDAEHVACLVNGTAVATFPRAVVIGSGKLASTDGAYGLRVNHNLDVLITGFRITKQ
ncbi:MAG: hypothetical protein ABI910_02090 [Gemmatimonadota bacterium]